MSVFFSYSPAIKTHTHTYTHIYTHTADVMDLILLTQYFDMLKEVSVIGLCLCVCIRCYSL